MGKGKPVRVGVIGLGAMGRTHLAAYRAAGKRCEVVAVCDRHARDAARPKKGAGKSVASERALFDRKRVRVFTDAAELLTDPAIDLLSICTPTDSHAELAIRALESGKHVLVEKPVALDSRAVRRVADAAALSKRFCMPAMCMRFWPGWTWLRDRVSDRAYGAVRSAVFRRVSSHPDWSDFYRDPDRTGGALVDLHIHDSDFIRWCFGDPDQVSSTGTRDHVTTFYRFGRGPAHVVAEGGWDHAPGFAFRMQFVVVFENATAEFDAARDPRLHLSRGGKISPVKIDAGAGYEPEVRSLLDAIRGERRSLVATMDDAVAVARILEAERRSLESGGAPVAL